MTEDRADHMSEEGATDEAAGPRALSDVLTGEDAEALVARVPGLAGTHLQQRKRELKASAREVGCRLYTVGGVAASDEETSFTEVVRAFASEMAERDDLSDAGHRLFEFLFRRSHGRDANTGGLDSQTYRNSLCRLWVELTKASPAVLAISHPRSLQTSDQRVLRQLVEYYYLDPVDDLFEGDSGGDAPRGGVVWLERPGVDEPWISDDRVITLKGGEAAESSVRTFLDRDEVVDRLVAATEGEPQRLEALVDALPSDTASIWEMRLRELDEEARRVLALLGAGEGSLPVEWFEAAVEELAVDVEVSEVTSELDGRGLIDKKIVDGELQIALFDANLGEVSLDRLDEETKREIHAALVEGIRSIEPSPPETPFMADLMLKAGMTDEGIHLGMRAARQCYAENSLQRAQAWFERLLEVSDSEELRREILEYLVGIYADNGHIEAAFDGLENLSALTDDATERLEAELPVAERLIRAGDADLALERVETVREEVSGESTLVRRRLELVEAKALSNQGENERAREMFREMVAEMTGADPLDGELSGAADDVEAGEEARLERESRVLVEARNELANMLMFDGDHDRAEALYDQNETLAEFYGWREEIERADINKAVLDIQRGDHEQALEVIRDYLGAAPVPTGVKRAKLMLNAATCLERLERYEEAIRHYRESLREARRIDDVTTFGFGAFNLASLLQRMGAFDEALELLDRIRGKDSQIPDYGILESYPTAMYCVVLSLQGRSEEAIAEFESMSGGLDEGRLPWLGRRLTLRVARAYVAVGRHAEARELIEQIDENKSLDALSRANRSLRKSIGAALRLEGGDVEEARELASEALDVSMEGGDYWTSAFAGKVQIMALEDAERTDAVPDVLEQTLKHLQGRVANTPSEYESAFYDVPVHQWLLKAALRHRERLESRVVDIAEQYARIERDDHGEDAAAIDESNARLRRKFPQIVGTDETLLEIFRRVDQVAESRAPVLIEGESGTGKELVANSVHRHSDRSDAPFVKVNCGAFVEELLLSELFGHEKGAFTGAVEQKMGRFEQADGGTIFLDEIGDISPKAQVSLLRVLQSGEFERVGGTETKQADVRVVCATNRSLDRLVDAGEFRLDLYYRLKGIVLELPALRDRRSDIPQLVHHFADRFSEETPVFSRRAMELLCSYSWPGNVRELKNFVRTVLLFTEDARIDVGDVEEFRDFFSEGEFLSSPPDIDFEVVSEESVASDASPTPSEPNAAESSEARAEEPLSASEMSHEDAVVEELIRGESSLKDLKSRLEKQSIERALRETEGNITRAAELLDMTRPRLSQIVNGDDQLLALKEDLVS